MVINELKLVLDSIKNLINKRLEKKADKTDIVQPDWQQNDETALDYVKNRTHYEEHGIEMLVPIETLEKAQSVVSAWRDDGEARVNINGVEYTEFLYSYALNGPTTYLHTITTLDGAYELQVSDTGWFRFTPESVVWYTYEIGTRVNQLDEKYVPDTIARIADVMSATDPVGRGSFSMNRKPDTHVGGYSHAEGCYTTASGGYSHAEGCDTTASGGYSHAEGYDTTASGNYSHAEGYDTIAASISQHVQGKYNIEDDADVYAHIVGNGESNSARSNAHTLDWSGNAWFAGDVYVGGTSQDDGERLVKASEIVQSDWSQSDSTQPDYIKNKPDESDALELVAEMGFVEPVAADDGSVYTDENGVVYTL